jgi:hypothetical protein
MKSKLKNIFTSSIEIFYLILIIFSIVFTRPFVGIYFGSFRLGELMIGGCILLTFFIVFLRNYFQLIEIRNISRTFIFITISFFFVVIVTNSNLLNLYAYKSSSYIWTLSFIFFGYLYFLPAKYNDLFFYLISISLISMYIISTGNYPNSVIAFFNEISDKFQFLKGSELSLVLIISNLLAKNKLSLRYYFRFLLISSFLYFPLLLFNSRAAFFVAVIFFVIEFFCIRKVLYKKNWINYILLFLSIPIFLISTFRVYGNLEFAKLPEYSNSEVISETVTDLIERKETTDVFLSFYLQDGRLRSKDSTTEWRLDIWQDVFDDMKSNSILLKGYGYNEIIPVMLDPTAPGRLGRDGLNENVHNYFVNIFARGSLLQLALFIILNIQIIFKYKNKFNSYNIISYLLPIYLMSSFDATLESVHFPFVFFTFLGYFLKNGIKTYS